MVMIGKGCDQNVRVVGIGDDQGGGEESGRDLPRRRHIYRKTGGVFRVKGKKASTLPVSGLLRR